MIYKAMINGIEVEATYTDSCVEQVLLPLLRHLTKLQKEKKGRILVMLAAPPAAGKSTMVSFLKYLSEQTEDVTPLVTIGMDGFHRYQNYLLSHTMMREGNEVVMVDVKGAPETFDLEKLTKSIQQVAAGEVIGWPDYNRMLHNPVENAFTVDGDIVLLEGNYLLLDWPGWNELKAYADYTIRIDADEEDLRQRLLERKIASGASYEKAVQFVESSDLYNAKTCLKHSTQADLVLRMDHDGAYFVS